jgi:hypothetical protein
VLLSSASEQQSSHNNLIAAVVQCPTLAAVVLITCMHCCCADRAGQVEQQLAACEASLQAERVAHSKLQADATLEQSTAAALRVGRQLFKGTSTAPPQMLPLCVLAGCATLKLMLSSDRWTPSTNGVQYCFYFAGLSLGILRTANLPELMFACLP